jgi:photosystem II stability/assembly factor-like uncharacterized protein
MFISCNRPKIEPKSPPDQPAGPLDGVTLGTTDQEEPESPEEDPKTVDSAPDTTGASGGDLIPILPSGTDIMIFEIQMADDLAGWAIGGADTATEHILRTEDGGNSWQDVTPPQPIITDFGNFTTANLGSWDGNYAWVNYTGSNMIWSTKDGGISWEGKEVTYTTHPEAMISILDQDHVWVFQFLDSAMHQTFTSLVQTQDGGDTWDLVLDPYQNEDIQSFYKTGATFVSSQHGWLTRDFDGVSPDIFLTKTMDGGMTWEFQSIFPPPSLPNVFNEGACGLYDPFLVAPDVGYFRLSCLYDENGQMKEKDFLYKTDKGGMSWDVLDTPGGEIKYINDLVLYSLGKDIERSSDGGLNWQFVKTVSWEGQFSFIDQNTAWVVAADKTDWENPKYALVKSTNGCQTFSEIKPVLVASSTVR